ncbi:manganese efflux pump MntP family protein [Pseudomonas sp. GX19020]|uniref:manganese efflux pump MntP n=1 Tax=Pseudomonadota TaxID=1224 RepID=UPI00089D6CA0|nr:MULTISPECIES: manganese efflux pump MntP family protein [Pseudomonadota]MCL4066559.1 manganese efflux pump MntP family protein [Pseudomonas sp. GX19020]SEB40271.1 Putative Mn2+ efflux pump MntP [Rhodobacter sp. 24-YEA-8]
MSPFTIGILAVSMSVDAFIASLGRGAGEQRPGLMRAVKTGAIFGVVEMVTPLIGWGLGMAASTWVQAVDHWIAFALLGAVGAHMLFQALSRARDEAAPAPGLRATVLTAIGTSIDAMAVGVSLALLEANIFVIAAAIGFTTMVMSASGVLAGRWLGRSFGRVMETFGGLALIAMGGLILFEHLTG